MERAVAALLPFVRAWRLQLNPEHLYQLAGAVLAHYDTDESWEELDAAVQAQVADFNRGRETIEESHRRQLHPTD